MTPSIDDRIEQLSVGRWQIPVLIATGLTWSGDAMELSAMAFVLPALKDEFHVSQTAADSFASAIFFGMLLLFGMLGLWSPGLCHHKRGYVIK